MLTGMIPAMITPCHDNHVNREVLEAYTDWLIRQGVPGIFPLGTTGEGLLLTQSEWQEALRVVIRAANRRVPVVVQCGGISLQDTTWRLEAAVESGADGVALMAPFFYHHKESAVEGYYDNILTTWSKTPVYLYNIPKYTHFDISAEMYARLCKRHDNLLGIKDSSGSMDTLRAFIAAAPDRAVLSGSDATVEEAFHAGAVGIVSGVAAVCPDIAVGAWKDLQSGDASGARKVKQIRDAFHRSSTIQAGRAVLQEAGFEMGDSFHPMPAITEQMRIDLREELQRIGVACGAGSRGTAGGPA